jgi:gliding motility-associated-like protein
VADFSFDELNSVAYAPMTFTNNSSGDIVYWEWKWGDGTPDMTTTIDPQSYTGVQHTYTDVAIYNVTLLVRNRNGCEDTITKRINLKPYIDLPNAFSPNGDGNNDGIRLIYRGIRVLQYYKIYNRWGELIFETSDLNQGWDGTYKGTDQELGVYVAHVTATDNYGTAIDFKKNITLLR